MSGPLPVTLLTGFLGAGKTALLARLIAQPGLRDTAVLVNEFGEVGLDHLLVAPLEGEVVLMPGGCVCCSIRDDLKAALTGLIERRRRGLVPPFGRVVIETTGLADPGPALATLLADPMLRHAVIPAGTVTVVDAVTGAATLAQHEAALRQVTAADRIVLSKVDLVPPETVAAMTELLARLNPTAPCRPLGLDAEPEAALILDAPAQNPPRFRAEAVAAPPDGPHAGIRSVLLEAGPLDWIRFGLWLSMLLHRHGERVLRLKGLVAVAGSPTPVVIQGVQHLIHPPLHLPAWPEAPRTRLVAIVRDLDPERLRRSFAAFTRAAFTGASGDP
ncbi:CobW family GTP-binding protein [Methylobacterium sp. ID0610]|uniref:CobW family GTP-binding protein n=1 Tax=Methylobacterium carpenticola TaxID=3344827 RepID=UPI0036D06C8B